MNKIITLVACLLITSATGIAKTKGSLQHFYDRHREDTHAAQLTLPKCLLLLSGSDKETRQVLRYVKSLKVFGMEQPEDKGVLIAGELSKALDQDGFERILELTDNENQVSIYVCHDELFIRKVLISISGQDELLVLDLKTKISPEQLRALVDDYRSGNENAALRKVIHSKGM